MFEPRPKPCSKLTVRPLKPRRSGCLFCGKSLFDPALDAPSRLGKLADYHYRCFNRDKRRRMTELRRARLEFKNVPPGCRVPEGDYRKVNGKGKGNARKRYARPGRYRSEQVCACGKPYIGGSAAVRCPECQVRHTRALKRAWHLANREANLAYLRQWQLDRHNTLAGCAALLAWFLVRRAPGV